MTNLPNLARLSPTTAVSAPKRARDEGLEGLEGLPRLDTSKIVTQGELQELFFNADSETEKQGAFGTVRRARVVQTVADVATATVTLAVKRQTSKTPLRARVIYREYAIHTALYECLVASYPSRLSHIARPLRIDMPCKVIDEPLRRSGDSPSRLLLDGDPRRGLPGIGAPETPRQRRALVVRTSARAGTPEFTPYKCTELEVYTAQYWACGEDDHVSTLHEAIKQSDYRADVWYKLGADVGMMLWCIHACGYKHNDLHWENVLICAGPSSIRAVIIDFGRASTSTSDDEVDRVDRVGELPNSYLWGQVNDAFRRGASAGYGRIAS